MFSIEFWGCPEDYFFIMGKCYKLFKEKVSHIEAKMACQKHDSQILKPFTYNEMEFLEYFINFVDTEAIIDNVWLDIRKGDTLVDPGDFFTDYVDKSSDTIYSDPGDCLVIKKDISNGKHLGWHRMECNLQAFYICEKSKNCIINSFYKKTFINSITDESLKEELKTFTKEPIASFPLSREDGPKEILKEEIEGFEKNLAFYSLWNPPGVIGSPLFDPYFNHNSYISWNMKDMIELENMLTIMMYIKPFNFDNDYLLMVMYLSFNQGFY